MKKNLVNVVVALSFAGVCWVGCSNNSASKSESDGKKECCAESAAPAVENMKKVIRAQVSVKPEKIDAYLEATQSMIEQSRAEEGNISYTLYQHPSEKTQFIVFEEWKDQAAIDFHFNAEHFKAFKAASGEYCSTPTVITIYDVISER